MPSPLPGSAAYNARYGKKVRARDTRLAVSPPFIRLCGTAHCFTLRFTVDARYIRSQEPEPQPKLKDLAELLEENGIESIMSKLDGDTLESLESQLASDRVGFLNGLKEKGVGNLVERQKLANAIGKAKRLDRF